MSLLGALGTSLMTTLRDVLPIALVIVAFQWLAVGRPLSTWKRHLTALLALLLGLALFLLGLELGVFPLGEAIARQLASFELLSREGDSGGAALAPWWRHHWTYAFAFSIAFSAAIAEPTLTAIAGRAEEISGGTIGSLGLRVAVALGAGVGVALGAFRIVVGIPLPWMVLCLLGILAVQTALAPRQIVPLAYDSGGVTTSTVMVPLVVALGLGLAGHLADRDPLSDGFGMILLAVLCCPIAVLGYAQLARASVRRRTHREARAGAGLSNGGSQGDPASCTSS